MVVDHLLPVDLAHLPGGDHGLHALVEGHEGVEGGVGVGLAPLLPVGGDQGGAGVLPSGVRENMPAGALRQATAACCSRTTAASSSVARRRGQAAGVVMPLTVRARTTVSGGAAGRRPPAGAGAAASRRPATRDLDPQVPGPAQQGGRLGDDGGVAAHRPDEHLAAAAVDGEDVARGEAVPADGDRPLGRPRRPRRPPPPGCPSPGPPPRRGWRGRRWWSGSRPPWPCRARRRARSRPAPG